MNWTKLAKTVMVSVLAAAALLCAIWLPVFVLTLASYIGGDAGVIVVLLLGISAVISPFVYRMLGK